jgi:hypothetical protein
MAAVDEAGVRMALDVCGASDAQKDAIVEEGFEGMADLLILDDKDISDMMSSCQ